MTFRMTFAWVAVALSIVASAAAAPYPTDPSPIAPAPAAPSTAAWPPIWPLPASYANGTGTAWIDPKSVKLVVFDQHQRSAIDVERAWNRFAERTFDRGVGATPMPAAQQIKQVFVTVVSAPPPLQAGVPEDYTLLISGPSAAGVAVNITATTVYGAYHGLETLSQLVRFDFDVQQYTLFGAPWAIHDKPRFPHRGLMIDSGRHYLPLRTIYNVIESATYGKFNVLHWHMVDDQSFAFESKAKASMPRLSQTSERYTAADVASVVEFARQRGIRVIVEIDTPGHSKAMCKAYPEMCPDPVCPLFNLLDITNNKTFEIVEGIWSDLARLVPERMVHIGGDEVFTLCWALHPKIDAWLKAHNMTLEGGYEYYIKRLSKWVWQRMPGGPATTPSRRLRQKPQLGVESGAVSSSELGQREVVGWQEIWDHFGTALDKRTIIQQWLPNSVSLPLNVTSHGYRLIWSDSSVWYLDHLLVSWRQMYDAEPCHGLPDQNCQLVLGGEACQWGETVDTSDIMQTIWPRAGAVAERLWSTRGTQSEQAVARMHNFRCLLNKRGVEAAPVDNFFARSAPPHPGSCYSQ